MAKNSRRRTGRIWTGAAILHRHALRQLLMDDEPLVGNNLDTPDMLAEGGRFCDVLAPAARSRYRL